jgi:hypothetical protein
VGQCGLYLSCQRGVCGKPAALGERCFHPYWSQIAHNDCQADLWCDDQGGNAEGVCRERAPEGGACIDGYDCVDGLTCRGASSSTPVMYGRCGALLEEGASCTFWADCRPDLYCDGAPGHWTCVPRKAAGATCTAFPECLSGSCDNGLCAAICTP